MNLYKVKISSFRSKNRLQSRCHFTVLNLERLCTFSISLIRYRFDRFRRIKPYSIKCIRDEDLKKPSY